jgi:hypothetical protein
MPRRSKRPLPVTSREQSLDMVPVRGARVREARTPAGLVRLTYPLALKPWFAPLAGRLGLWSDKPREKTVELDEMGTYAWDLLDGETTVRALARAFEEQYQLHPREAEHAVAAFVGMLGKRGILALK